MLASRRLQLSEVEQRLEQLLLGVAVQMLAGQIRELEEDSRLVSVNFVEHELEKLHSFRHRKTEKLI